MKSTITLIVALALAAHAQTPTPTPPLLQGSTPVTVNVSELRLVTINFTDLGQFINAGPIGDAIKRYPALAPLIRSQLEAGLDTMDEPTLSKRLAELSDAGVSITKAAADKHATRIEKFRRQREAALLKVKDTDPARAKQKLEELLAAKIPIDSKIQDAVNRAATPIPPATPAPTPNDGL